MGKKKISIIVVLEVILYIVGIALLTFSILYGIVQFVKAKDQNDKVDRLRNMVVNPLQNEEYQNINQTKEKSIVAEENDTADSQEEVKYVSPYEPVFELSKDVRGWLLIPGTRIDYPVMQTKQDEMFYLHHDFDGNPDNTGTLFFAAGVNLEKEIESDNFLIYGHNMRSGSMFGDLDLYKKESYRAEHPTIYLYLKDREYRYEVISAGSQWVLGKNQYGYRYYSFYDAETQSDWDAFCEKISETNVYGTEITATDGDQLITLSTCAGSGGKTSRFVIVGKRKK